MVGPASFGTHQDHARPEIGQTAVTLRERHSGLELSDVADRVLKERIQRLPGVGGVFIGGERRYAMRIWLDPQRMASHGLTTQDVEQAVARENAEIPAGRVEGKEREFSVRTRGDLFTAEEFGAIIVKQQGTETVRLSDVADVTVGAEDERSTARWNGKEAVGLGIVKQSKASTIDVCDAVNEALPLLAKELPSGMKLDIAYDSSGYIKDSINDVAQTIFIAMLLVVLVILLFLKTARATLIPSPGQPRWVSTWRRMLSISCFASGTSATRRVLGSPVRSPCA
jgi:multidrug efflux pump